MYIGEDCNGYFRWFVFRCDQGLVPKPDTITGCGPECVVDPDCQYGYICQDQK